MRVVFYWEEKLIFYLEENRFSTGKKIDFLQMSDSEISHSETSGSEISVFQRYTLGRHEYGASGKIA